MNVSCQEKRNEATSNNTKEIQETKPAIVYPRLPQEQGNMLLTKADGLEGSFYHSGKSISMWNENVKNILAMMTEVAPTFLNNNIVGHVMYLEKGNEIAFVEISLSPNNNYVIYTIDGQKYYNTLNAQGVQFFNQLATAPAAPSPVK